MNNLIELHNKTPVPLQSYVLIFIGRDNIPRVAGIEVDKRELIGLLQRLLPTDNIIKFPSENKEILSEAH